MNVNPMAHAGRRAVRGLRHLLGKPDPIIDECDYALGKLGALRARAAAQAPGHPIIPVLDAKIGKYSTIKTQRLTRLNADADSIKHVMVTFPVAGATAAGGIYAYNKLNEPGSDLMSIKRSNVDFVKGSVKKAGWGSALKKGLGFLLGGAAIGGIGGATLGGWRQHAVGQQEQAEMSAAKAKAIEADVEKRRKEMEERFKGRNPYELTPLEMKQKVDAAAIRSQQYATALRTQQEQAEQIRQYQKAYGLLPGMGPATAPGFGTDIQPGGVMKTDDVQKQKELENVPKA